MRTLTAVFGIIVLILVLMVAMIGGDQKASDLCVPASAPSTPGGVPDGEFSKPMKKDTYTITSGYRSADRPDHQGVDLAGPDRTPIYAFADGVVAAAGYARGFGRWIIVDHMIDGRGFSTVYGHMWPDGLRVTTGDRVRAGQHIADSGNNGESSGPHLHFEVWEGGRLTGGHPVDPMPWLDRAVEPGSTDRKRHPDGPPATGPTEVEKYDGRQLPPLPARMGSEEHWQRDTVRLARAVAVKFPQLQTIGGWRPHDRYDDHPSGRAADIMIPNYTSTEGIALGDEILAYIRANADVFHVEYTIWRQRYQPPPGQGEGNIMEDRFSPTENHFDHIHVTVEGHGHPDGSEEYGPAPDGTHAEQDCLPGESGGHSDAELNADKVPEEARKWVVLAGRVCPEVSAPLMAGLVETESNWSTAAVSEQGAGGPAQFIPETWAGIGAKVDESGAVVGPPGSGSRTDWGDALMASARYLCQIRQSQAPKIASGRIRGDAEQLMLAGYNAGPGAVDSAGGIPQYSETQSYVVKVPAAAQRYTK